MMLSMEVSCEGLPTYGTCVVGFRSLGGGRVEDLGEVALLWMEGSGMILEVFLVREAFVSEAV